MASFLEDCSKTVTEIRNDIVCQICGDPARPGIRQWYRCLKLHQICQECKEKNKKCSCGDSISTEFCKQTEKVLGVNGLKFNCVNAKNGCKEAFVENALDEHESECIYRQVPCLFNVLNWNRSFSCKAKVVAFHDLIEHYEQHFKIKLFACDLSKVETVNVGKSSLAGANCWLQPCKYTLNNQTFLLCEKTTNKVVYKWVYILGSPIEAKHFCYTLKLIGKETETAFKAKVASIDESFGSLCKAGKCFTIPHEAFMAQFVDEDNKYKYSLEIRNLKEEAKDDNYESGISDNDDDSKE